MKAREQAKESGAKRYQGYNAQKGDMLDEMLARYVNEAGCQVPIKKLGDGFYLFGTRKIFARI